MMTFNLDFSVISLAALGIALVAGIIASGPGLFPQRRTGKQPPYVEPESPEEEVSEASEASEASEISEAPEAPEASEEKESSIPSPAPVAVKERPRNVPLASVIAYTPDYSDSLDEFIADVRKQDYPCLELILVLDAGAEVREMLVEKYAGVPDLYLTFIPPGSQNLSRRKLAITIGMKAAKGEVAVLTSSLCRIPSDKWLTGMMSPFLESRHIEVALGYARADSVGARGPQGAWRRWLSADTAMRWIGYALEGRPYRGDGFNLAFRRELFFRHKGFAQTVNLHAGEEDLFVNEIAQGGNTRMVTDSDTILTVMWGDSASKMWVDRRESHDFTSRWLPRGPFRRGAMLSWCQWLLLAGCVTGAVASLPNLVPVVVAAILLIAFFIAETFVWSRGYRVLAPATKWWSTPLFLLWKPIANRLFRWRHRSERVKNYTWQRQRRRS